jgi:predicted GH43/DUF377 family glycosyl hydrolase
MFRSFLPRARAGNLPEPLIRRSRPPPCRSVFAPEKEWEKVGQVPNVVFVEGMVRWDGKFLFYYGGADKFVGVAEADEIKR